MALCCSLHCFNRNPATEITTLIPDVRESWVCLRLMQHGGKELQEVAISSDSPEFFSRLAAVATEAAQKMRGELARRDAVTERA